MLARVIIIVCILLLLVYPHVAYRYTVKNTPAKLFTEFEFHTGDIIMTKYDDPCIFFAKNGFNIKPSVSKNIADSIQYYSQGHYTHCAVVVVLDQPYIYHLTDDICYDEVTHGYKIGTPSLVPIRDMIGYHGILYHHAVLDKYHVQPETIKTMMGKFNQQMQGNLFKTVMANGVNIIKPAKCDYTCKYVCTDFARDVLTYLAIAHNIPEQPDLTDFVNHCKERCYNPVIIRTAWYDHAIDPQ